MKTYKNQSESKNIYENHLKSMEIIWNPVKSMRVIQIQSTNIVNMQSSINRIPEVGGRGGSL